jgi:hypothetical protein
VIAGIEKFYKAGGRVEGGEIQITQSKIVRRVPTEAALVSLTYDQSAGRLVDGNGQEQITAAKKGNRVLITLARKGTGWTLTNIQGVA